MTTCAVTGLIGYRKNRIGNIFICVVLKGHCRVGDCFCKVCYLQQRAMKVDVVVKKWLNRYMKIVKNTQKDEMKL